VSECGGLMRKEEKMPRMYLGGYALSLCGGTK